MAARLYRVILPVSDIDKATRFYAAVLNDQGQRISDGRHYFDCGGTILACFDPKADGDDYEPTPNPEWLYFSVDDVKAVRDSCIAEGGTPAPEDIHGAPAGEIHRRPWGEVSFYAHDPFGNGICFVQQESIFTGQ